MIYFTDMLDFIPVTHHGVSSEFVVLDTTAAPVETVIICNVGYFQINIK